MASRSSTKPPPKDSCFVIMPFGDWFDDYYRDLYRPSIIKAGLEPKRSDDLCKPSQIVQDIWECTKKAKVLLADLTGKNPNVFYELGLAHALGKPVVLVTESIEHIPFDLRSLRCIIYEKNQPNWGNVLKREITLAITEVISDPGESILQTFVDTEKKMSSKRQNLPLKRQVSALQDRVEILSRQNMELNKLKHSIGPNEATEIIRRYLNQDIPKSIIINRLQNMGVPGVWVEGRIKDIVGGIRKN